MNFLSRTTALAAATLLTVGAGVALATSPVPPTTEPVSTEETTTIDEGFSLEIHLFNGSSSHVAAFNDWFAGGDFVEPGAYTRDVRSLELPNGEIAEAGDSIVKYFDGSFGILGAK